MITEQQLRARARKVEGAEAALEQAMSRRDAAITQAAAEGRYSNMEIATMIGVSRARIGRIVRDAWDTSRASRATASIGTATLTRAQLHDVLRSDLDDIYYRAGREVVNPDTGKPYWPHYFHHGRNGRGGLTQADDGTVESLVAFVASTVSTVTTGASVLARAGRLDLLVETLVLDRAKPYHSFFDADTLASARRNLMELA
jgi:hypothetical protein